MFSLFFSILLMLAQVSNNDLYLQDVLVHLLVVIGSNNSRIFSLSFSFPPSPMLYFVFKRSFIIIMFIVPYNIYFAVLPNKLFGYFVRAPFFLGHCMSRRPVYCLCCFIICKTISGKIVIISLVDALGLERVYKCSFTVSIEFCD